MKWVLKEKWDHRVDLLQVGQRDRDQVSQVDLHQMIWLDQVDQDLKDRDQVNQAAHQQMIWQDQADQVQDQLDSQMCQDQVYNQVDLHHLQVKELGEMDHHHQVGRDQNLIQQVDLLQVDLLQVDLIWDQMGLRADLLQVNRVDLLRVDQIWIL